MLTGETGDETAAADFAARFEPAVDAQQLPPRRQPVCFAFEQAPEHHAIAAQQGAGYVLDRRRLAIARAAVRRASAHLPALSMPKAERRRPPSGPGRRLAQARGYQQCAQAAEAVRAHEAEADQLGQPLFDLGGQQTRAVDQLIEKRRPVLAEVVGYRPCRRR